MKPTTTPRPRPSTCSTGSDIEEQKPVLAHELTHALQDQHTDLEKWSDQTPDNVSLNAPGDTDHLAKDEMDTAREAVAEGQATAVMMDYILKPMGKSLVKDPEVMDVVKQQMTTSEDSPVLSRAPLMLSESLLFPYREGLSFEQRLRKHQRCARERASPPREVVICCLTTSITSGSLTRLLPIGFRM